MAADTVKVSGNRVELHTAKANSTVNHVYLDKKKSLVKRESTNAVDDATTTVVTKSEAPKDKNTLTTKSLEMKDIQNEAEYTYSNNGIGYNYYGSKKKLEEMKTKDKKGYDKIYNSIGLVPNLGVGSKGKASSTTQSAISDGILTVDGKKSRDSAVSILKHVYGEHLIILNSIDQIGEDEKIILLQLRDQYISKNNLCVVRIIGL